MKKIDYPKDPNKFELFKSEYCEIFSKEIKAEIDLYLQNFIHNNSKMTFNRLVTLSFEEMLEIKSKIKKHSDSINKINTSSSDQTISINPFEQLFDYKGNQNNIAQFFMTQKEMRLDLCFYCELDYINAFVDRDAYKDSLHFLNEASEKDLQKIEGVGSSISAKIINHRKDVKGTDIHEYGLKGKVLDRIKNMDFVNSHNHFTLDHVLPQSEYKYFSLCLFNLVPSCYSCNSKFKKSEDFLQTKGLMKICPTSNEYSIHEDLEFNLYCKKNSNKIDSVDDFEINSKIIRNENHIKEYLSIFKINGRYNYHKNQLIPLIKNRVNYSDSRILEISKQIGMPTMELKKLLFGEDVIDETINGKPLTKLRRDIWKFINQKIQ